MADDDKNNTNNIDGEQYHAARDTLRGNRNVSTGSGDIYDHPTFIGSATLTQKQRQKVLADYLNYLRKHEQYIDVAGGFQLPLADVYVNLQAAHRYDNPSQERVHAALDELKKKLVEDKRLSDVERSRKLDELAFYFRAGLDAQAEQMSLDKAVATYPRLVIIGEPGSGKTTLLRYVSHTFATVDPETEVPDFGHWRLPVYVRLTDLANDRDLLAVAAKTISKDTSQDNGQVREMLRHYMREGRLLLLLDGLDEVDTKQRTAMAARLNRIADDLVGSASVPHRVSLNSQAQGNRVIVTCRVASYYTAALSNANAHYLILGLKPADRGRFLGNWLRAYARERNENTDEGLIERQAAELTRKLDAPNLDRLAEVPLLLSLIAYIWKQSNDQLPATRIQLYAEATDLMFHRREPYPDGATLDRITDSITALSYCLNANRDSGTLTEEEAKSFFPADLHDWWTWLVESAGIFAVRSSQRLVDKRGKATEEKLYGFPHRTFEEYFAALWIGSQNDISFKSLISHHLHDPRWDEVLLLAFSYISLHDTARAARLLDELYINPPDHSTYEDLFHRDLLFAVRACGEGVELQDTMMQGLVDKMLVIYFDLDQNKRHGKYELLHAQLDRALDSISSSGAREYAASSIINMASENNIEVLERTAIALGHLGVSSDVVVVRLLDLICHEDWKVSAGATWSLQQLSINHKIAANYLLDVLGSGDSNIRAKAAEALGIFAIGDEIVADKLVGLLDDEDIEVRESAAIALGELKVINVKVIGGLVSMLHDEDNYTRSCSVKAIGDLVEAAAVVNDARINQLNEQAAGIILGFLQEPGGRYDNVRPLAVDTLWALKKDAEVVDTLLKCAKDEDDFVRLGVAIVLGEVKKNDEVISALLEMAGDSLNLVRETAIEALRNHGVDRDLVAVSLVAQLDSIDNMKRDDFWRIMLYEGIMEAIEDIGVSTKIVISKLMMLLNEENISISACAARTLAQLGVKNKQIVNALLSLLEDGDFIQGTRAIATLLHLKAREEGFISVLLNVLNGSHSHKRIKAAEALLELGVATSEATQALYYLLSSEDAYICVAAAEALARRRKSSVAVLDELCRIAYSEHIKDAYSNQPYNAAYEALYTLVTAQCRTEGDEAACAMLKPRPADW